MTLVVFSVPKEGFEALSKQPEVLSSLLEDDREEYIRLGMDSIHDRFEADYLSLSESMAAIAEEMGEGPSRPEFDETSILAFDRGHGNAKYLSPEDWPKVSQNETWDMLAVLEEGSENFFRSLEGGQRYAVFMVI